MMMTIKMRGIMYFCCFICPLYFLSLYLCHRIFAVVFRLLWSGLEVDDLAAFLSSAMSFTFICFLFLICNPFSVLKVAQARDNIPLLIVMDHNLRDDGFCESGVNEEKITNFSSPETPQSSRFHIIPGFRLRPD